MLQDPIRTLVVPRLAPNVTVLGRASVKASGLLSTLRSCVIAMEMSESVAFSFYEAVC